MGFEYIRILSTNLPKYPCRRSPATNDHQKIMLLMLKRYFVHASYLKFQPQKKKKEGDPYVKNRFWKSYTEITDF